MTTIETTETNEIADIEALVRKATKDETKAVLCAMLTEKTGRSILDSGDAYGRHWQQNQGLTVETLDGQPEATADFSLDFVDVGLNVYHFLRHRLDFALELDALFRGEYRAYCEAKKSEELDLSEITDGDDFANYLKSRGCVYVEADDEGEGILTVNTYNNENLLSQTILYRAFRYDENNVLVILQIHGGCDPRGGYTDPKIFLADYIYKLADNAQGTVECEGKDGVYHTWDNDGSMKWIAANNTEGDNLDDYEFLSREDFDADPAKYGGTFPVPGYLCTDGGTGYCPFCGAELRAYAPST